MSQMCKECGSRPAGWERGPLAGRCEECAKPIREAMRAGASKPRVARESASPATPTPASPGLRAGFELKARELVPVGRRIDRSIVKLSNHKKKGQPIEAEVRAALALWRETCQKLAGDVPAQVGARGPAPSPNSVTRHKPKQRRRDLSAARPGVPDLVASFPALTFLPQTLAWWDAWVHSPQAAFFAATDWQTLLRLAPLIDAYWSKPSAPAANAILATEAKLGATAADRDRLGWKIEEPTPDAGDVPAEKGARSRPDPRKAK